MLVSSEEGYKFTQFLFRNELDNKWITYERFSELTPNSLILAFPPEEMFSFMPSGVAYFYSVHQSCLGILNLTEKKFQFVIANEKQEEFELCIDIDKELAEMIVKNICKDISLEKNHKIDFLTTIFRPYLAVAGNILTISKKDTKEIIMAKVVSAIDNLRKSAINEIGAKTFSCIEKEEYQIENLRNMSYNEYLKTEHWENIRLKALAKADFKCQLCNSRLNLNVHHRTYENRGCEKDGDVIVLCRKCHAKHHDKLI